MDSIYVIFRIEDPHAGVTHIPFGYFTKKEEAEECVEKLNDLQIGLYKAIEIDPFHYKNLKKDFMVNSALKFQLKVFESNLGFADFDKSAQQIRDILADKDI